MSAAAPTRDAILQALRPVKDPEIDRSLVELGMIKDLEVHGDHVAFLVELTTPACPLKSVIQADCEKAVRAVPGVRSVSVRFGANVRAGAPGGAAVAPNVRNMILVGSGKGGVGKSTVAVNLAVALSQAGARTGLLDADVYGPSIPVMLGVHDRPSANREGRIAPIYKYGLPLMSIGFLVDPDTAMVWRGPMLSGAVKQFLSDVEWGELDYLIIDLPPGTGDVQLTLAQQGSITGAVVVTTPQDVALADVVRACAMFDKVRIPVLGLVENMSVFACPDCGARHAIFDEGGGERAAGRLGVPFLGVIPIDPAIRRSGDAGEPVLVSHPESATAAAFRAIAGRLAARISVRTAGASGPTFTAA
jgi:ATP-binding protein involved in chromosome partitioning